MAGQLSAIEMQRLQQQRVVRQDQQTSRNRMWSPDESELMWRQFFVRGNCPTYMMVGTTVLDPAVEGDQNPGARMVEERYLDEAAIREQFELVCGVVAGYRGNYLENSRDFSLEVYILFLLMTGRDWHNDHHFRTVFTSQGTVRRPLNQYLEEVRRPLAKAIGMVRVINVFQRTYRNDAGAQPLLDRCRRTKDTYWWERFERLMGGPNLVTGPVEYAVQMFRMLDEHCFNHMGSHDYRPMHELCVDIFVARPDLFGMLGLNL